jgi:hypothetical protein
MLSKNLKYFILGSAIIFFYSCGVPVGSRYAQETKETSTEKTTKEKKSVEKVDNNNPENFNLDKYRSRIEIKDNKSDSTDHDLDAWYNYHVLPNKSDTSKTIIKNVPGYRVQVASTDNLDAANQLRSEIYFKTNQKAVYVIFDPPFYKIEIGDFIDINDAKNLSFKLKQMGYPEARVVNETINIFE